MASLEEINTLKAQIAEHEAVIREHTITKNALEKKLSKLTEVPTYINYCIKCLVGLFGRNEEWEEKIKKVMTARLKSKPVYKEWDEVVEEYVTVRVNNVEYDWNDKEIDYYTVYVNDEKSNGITSTFDNYEIYAGFDPIDKRAVKVHAMCNDIISKETWDALETFTLKYLPILIGYIDNDFPEGRNFYD
jgi:hypothetical protein